MEQSPSSSLDLIEKNWPQQLEKVQTLEELKDLRVALLGKKGQLTAVLKSMGKLSPEDKKSLGQKSNKIKVAFEKAYQERLIEIELSLQNEALAQDQFDSSIPGLKPHLGSRHPIHEVLAEVEDFFFRLGFDVHQGPQIETDFYNFEALNIPADHPARDMQDTFYLDDQSRVLRTHTSPVQIRVMQEQKPPIRMIAPGPVYRHDSDVSHTPMFHQIEGLCVDRKVSFADLRGVLELFINSFFAKKLPLRFRSSFFPFTEPSAEVDMACVVCSQKGCRVCSQTGWLEVMGCGLVDPEVFRAVGIDSEEWSGFAFGIGIERMAMLRHGIDDIRLFYENDIRFLRQFAR